MHKTKGKNMKKFLLVTLLFCMGTMPAMADDYGYNSTPQRDTYVGLRLHKNDNIAFRYEPENGDGITLRDGSFGFGAMIGNRLTDHVKIEFETEYTYGGQSKYGSDYSFNVWANMLNVYVYQQFGGAVEPYAGLGVGVSGLWGEIDGNINASDATADMSWSIMAGVNFALNDRIDLNLGVKYQNYGDLGISDDNGNNASIEVDGTEFYISAAYKFGL